MSNVHPMFQNLLNAVAGKTEPQPTTYHFEVEVRATFNGGYRSLIGPTAETKTTSIIATWNDSVQAPTEEEAALRAARAIFDHIVASSGAKPSHVEVLSVKRTEGRG